MTNQDPKYLDLDQSVAVDGANTQLLALVEDYTFYSSGQKEMEESKKLTATAILQHLQDGGWDGVDYSGQRYKPQTTTTRRIVKEKLLERGVSPSVIEWATEESVSMPFLRGYKVKV